MGLLESIPGIYIYLTVSVAFLLVSVAALVFLIRIAGSLNTLNKKITAEPIKKHAGNELKTLKGN